MFCRQGMKLGRAEIAPIAVLVVSVLLVGVMSAAYLDDRYQIENLNSKVSSLQASLRQYENEVSALQSQTASLPNQFQIPSQDLTATSENVFVTINGLTCQMPTPQPQILYTLVPKVVQDPRFLNLTQGTMYAFGNGEEMTNAYETAGNITTQLPDMMEMVFYHYDSSAYCGPSSVLVPWTNTIVVHVPYENGNFNMADATFGRSFP
jgi:cell division protein FtsL